MTSFGRRDGGGNLRDRLSVLTERPAVVAPDAPVARVMDAPSAPAGASREFARAQARIRPLVAARIDESRASKLGRAQIASEIEKAIDEEAARKPLRLDPGERRALVTTLINELTPSDDVVVRIDRPAAAAGATARANVESAAPKIYPLVMERIDSEVAARLSRQDLAEQLSGIVQEILLEQKIQLNQREQRDLVTLMLNDMLGLGPLEGLLADDTINDILVNGAKSVYVERRGKLEKSDVTFRNDAHVMSIATRIVSSIGRRIDESTPLVDARLQDGSRVNIIIPPLAIDGPSISIRKFSKKTIDLDVMTRQGNISPAMATVLKIAARSKLNILISGGTGSGKTTLLNAMSQMIDPTERVVTIEDAAELQLQQPHVVRLETRPPNLEGRGEISMRELVKNTLRMRPDRIIVGEIRGDEAMDMLQAMNTGHNGSLGTIHANRPREAIGRLENMVGMSGMNLSPRALRIQIAAAIHMIVQIERMRDGVRRVTSVTEIVGMEGDIITTQELFSYKYEGERADGMLRGRFESAGIRPAFLTKAEYYGLDRLLMEAIG